MARRTKLNPDGTGFQVGPNVRVERGLTLDQDGHVHRGSQVVWKVYRKVDVSGDENTTYDYRYEEDGSFPEVDAGECPQAALDRADALAGEE